MFAAATVTDGVNVFGVRLVGVSAQNGHKLLLTAIWIAGVWALSWALRLLARSFVRNRSGKRIEFWTRQAIQIATTVLIIIGLLSIWFSDPSRLATFLGLISAGLAFAMQRVVTAVCGYVVLLRGKTFNVGERIKMGGVRGDVVALGFIQTTIMEMGQPPAEQSEDPGMWVQARQYTGRIVTVTNDKIFDEPVYNYSRDFPFLWEEMRVGIQYGADRHKAEQILLEIARRHTEPMVQMSAGVLKDLERRYYLRPSDLEPRVFWRLTDNWLEMALRFVCRDYDIRSLKDRMTRDILAAFDENHLEIASGTYEIVGMPEVKVKIENPSPNGGPAVPGLLSQSRH
ncbi:MAG TPA: mechanosensitive ion channel domain-containing protein [Bryobacteraceae bacterium]|nr:mechanosensitive ion channel domain-containing protein [Bryobacteraceae bacterium]